MKYLMMLFFCSVKQSRVFQAQLFSPFDPLNFYQCVRSSSEFISIEELSLCCSSYIDFIIDQDYKKIFISNYNYYFPKHIYIYMSSMSKSISPQKQNTNPRNFKKNVKGYTISYCQKQFLGRSLYGEVRIGYETNQKKLKAFRINSLPMSEQAKANLQLQKYYSQLTQCTRQIYDTIQSQSNRYTVMEYFPRTFKTQLAYFRKLTKNMEPYIQKFLQTYAKLYYYRIIHGNISLDNVGITFDGRVKLMDFKPLDDLTFEEASVRDYRDFRNMICFILEKDKLFPTKFQVFDDPQGNWQKLFSVWHVVNSYQFIYRQKKLSEQNITVLLSKLETVIYPVEEQEEEQHQNTDNICNIPKQNISSLIKIAIRLLMLSTLRRVSKKDKKITQQINQLQRILSPLQVHDINFYNSIIWGCINDPNQYHLHQAQRLTLIMCLLPFINHEYFYIQILKQFQPSKEDASKFQLYSTCLIQHYAEQMKKNLIQI